MAVKKFVVREGFNYRVRDDRNNEKVYSEGDTVDLEETDGNATHQLQRAEADPAPAGKKD